jgi:hypothetical protein
MIVSLSTLMLAVATIWLVWESRQSSYRQLRLESWMHFEERWDAPQMKKARYALAAAIKPHYDPSKADDVPEEVLDFFESVGSVFDEGLINSKLTEMSFSYDAVGWWEACKPYVLDQRKKNGDKTIYDKFERFAKPNQKRSSPLIKPNAGSGLASISFSRGMICAGWRSRIAW